MIWNYFKIAWRNIKNSKSFSFLNIIGLSVGMCCSILILLWVQNEISYDKFHSDSESIYRFTANVNDFKAAVSPAGMGPDLKKDLPEINSAVRISKLNTFLVEVGSTKFEEDGLLFADANFLTFFDFPLIRGDKNTVLNEPNSIVLTEAMAYKYFGNDDALGKIITLNTSESLVVKGILKNLVSNSHLKFDFLISMATIAETDSDLKNNTWGNFNYYTYFKLNKNVSSSSTSVKSLEAKITDIYSKREETTIFEFHLQPLSDIHLHSDLQIDVGGHGNIQYVNIFFIVALFILVVACINFMNLATARFANRSKEVGLRKTVGASRMQLIIQFLTESVLLSFISLIIAVGLVLLLLPQFNELSGKELTIDLTNGLFWINLLIVMLVTGLLSGSYPAIFLSGFNPIKVLQGRSYNAGGNIFFRNGLVITQFVVSAVLIVGTIVVYNQLSFIKSKNLGFDKSNLITVPFKGEISGKQDALKAALLQNPLTENFSIISEGPTNNTTGTIGASWEGQMEKNSMVIPSIRGDENFIDIFQLELVAGRKFLKELSTDLDNFIVNEAMMRLMGKDETNIIGQKLYFSGTNGIVIGLVKDFHFKPLQYDIEPLVIRNLKDGAFLMVKTTLGQTEDCLAAIREMHTALNPAYPFEYSFLDEDLEHQYLAEKQMGSIFYIFALLAIFISCLGIYGLSAFMAEQRTKEIGIRKVLGASVAQLVNLLSIDFFKLVLIALIIAIPISWYYLNDWLQEFAYHINISWVSFLISSLIILIIALLTVSYQSINAALSNPIKSLKTE